MQRDRPGAAVPADAELPEGFTVGDFADILSALSLATVRAAEAGDERGAEQFANLQERIFFANPESVLMVDEVFADRFGQLGDVEPEEILSREDALGDIDTEAVRNRVRPDGEVDTDADMADIDID